MPEGLECPHDIALPDRNVCFGCVLEQRSVLRAIEEIDEAAETMIAVARNFPEWKSLANHLGYTVTLMMHEICMNAVEHGILGLGSARKKKLLAEMEESYHPHIAERWKKSGRPVRVHWCISADVIAITVNDGGNGFDHRTAVKPAIAEEDILQDCGRGLLILRSMGVAARWNEKGNGVVCSVRRADLAELVQSRSKKA